MLRPRPILLFLVGVAAVALLGFAVIEVPRQIARVDCRCCNAAETAKSISDNRGAFLQFLVTVAGAITVYFTWKNYTRSLREADINFGLARESRASDNFAKAIEQLGNASEAVRAGGALGLGRLLRTATPEGDYWPIIDVLTTFVRKQAPCTEFPHVWKPGPDVQTALNVLARRSATKIPDRVGDPPLNLRECDLKLAWMSDGNFQGADLTRSRLVEVDLTYARLEGSKLCDADLTLADLTGADLSGADLSGATVTADQLAAARGDERTKLPHGLSRPRSWG